MVLPFEKRALSEDDIALMREKNVWKGEGPVGPDRLSLLTLTYIDFDGNTQQGQMMVMDVVADSVLEIFKELYEAKFPIANMALMSDFEGDDERAMSANAATAFVSRNVAGSSRYSLHAYGCAIDINQIQNPMLSLEEGQLKLYPPESDISYLNRSEDRPGKPKRLGLVESIVPIFRKHAFTEWGGDWDTPLDYHHFQLPRALAEELATTDVEQGKKLIAKHLKR